MIKIILSGNKKNIILLLYGKITINNSIINCKEIKLVKPGKD